MIVWSLWQCSHLEGRVQLYCRVRHSLYYIATVLLGCVLLTAMLHRLSEVELCDNLMLLILAGHDTSRYGCC
jgi:hypothetical protein